MDEALRARIQGNLDGFERIPIRDSDLLHAAVAVVVTNRRFAAYGVLHGGCNSRRAEPDETLVDLEVADFSATLVTNRRVLNYSGRSGAWSETHR